MDQRNLKILSVTVPAFILNTSGKSSVFTIILKVSKGVELSFKCRLRFRNRKVHFKYKNTCQRVIESVTQSAVTCIIIVTQMMNIIFLLQKAALRTILEKNIMYLKKNFKIIIF